MSVKGFKLSDGTVVKYDYSSLDNIITDSTLSVDGVAADAGAVGDEFLSLQNKSFDYDEFDRLKLTGLSGTAGQTTDKIAELTNAIGTETSARMAADAGLASDIAVERARISTIVAGTTPGSDELVDIRVGDDGVTYSTAGDAVRGQIAAVKQDLYYATGYIETPVTVQGGAVGSSWAGQRLLFYDQVPPNTVIKSATIPVGGVGGFGVLNIEVWELGDDNDTLTRVKVVNPTLVANTDIVAEINHYSDKKRYVGIMFSNVQVSQTNLSGSHMYVAYNTTLDTTTLSLSGISTFNNYCPTGSFIYAIITTAHDTPYKLPIKWRHGIIASTGDTYLTKYGCITDFIIPTSIADYIQPLDTTYEINICYYNESNGKPTFVSRSADTNAKIAINKSYPYFAINIFKSWSTEINPTTCGNIVGVYSVAKFDTEGLFEKLYHNKPILNKNDIWSICHQGYNDDTLGRNRRGGYALSALRGFTHGECDIKLTSDNKVVCCHDDTFVDATSGVTITIANKTLAELQACNYYGTTIATLGEIIEECKRYGLGLFIDQVSIINVDYMCEVVSQYNAWDICTIIIGYNEEYPDLAGQEVAAVKRGNENARIAILANISNYTNALAYAMTLDNAIFYIGQYLKANLSVIQSIASQLNGKCLLMIWTVDGLIPEIYNALPYINGWCSNAWSGNDVFNPTINNGM